MNSLKDYLNQMEADSTDVEKLAAGLALPAEGTLAEGTPAEGTLAEDGTKIAGAFDLEGLVQIVDDRINAAFEKVAELQKEAVGAVGPTPDPQAVPENPGVQLSRELGPEQQVTNSQIAQLIAQLTNGERLAGPNGYIAGPAGIMGEATARGIEPPIAADGELVAQANDYSKAATNEVAEIVWNRYFSGEQ